MLEIFFGYNVTFVYCRDLAPGTVMIALNALGRDCTNNNGLFLQIGVL